jgi:hypothetical protein
MFTFKQSIFRKKTGFKKQFIHFHRPYKIVCQTSGRQNHWFLFYTVSSRMILSFSDTFSFPFIVAGGTIQYMKLDCVSAYCICLNYINFSR